MRRGDLARVRAGGPIGLLHLMEAADPMASPDDVPGWVAQGIRFVGIAWSTPIRRSGSTRDGHGLTPAGFALLEALLAAAAAPWRPHQRAPPAAAETGGGRRNVGLPGCVARGTSGEPRRPRSPAMRLHPSPVLLAAALLVTGCGGAGGGSGNGPVTVTLEALPALVGTIADGGYVTPQFLGIGDRAPPSAPQITFRGFLTFDLAALPPGARVRSATLTLHQVRVAGTPYDTLGPMLVDQVVYGTVLEAGAYDRSFPTSQGALLSLDATLGPKLADATSQVQADLAANRTLSQWRVRFAVEADGNTSSDQVDLGAPGTSEAATQPTLAVTYER